VSKKQTEIKEVPLKVIPDNIYLLAAFIEGAVVLSVEILGAKMLAAFFGNSLMIWTSVIGVTITFLTLGYYAGGFLSRKNNLYKILSYALSIAALLILIMPSWAPSLFSSLIDTSLYTGGVLGAILLIGPPMFVLGTTSPVIIQQLTKQVSDAGKKAGIVYAISTLGGIFFIFLFGFWVIPYVGISLPLALLSVGLFLFSLYIFKTKKHIIIGIIFLLFMFKVIKDMQPQDSATVTVPYITEGMLGQLKVLDVTEPRSHMPLRHLLINGIPQTRIFNRDERAISAWDYVHKVAMTASLKHNSKNVLLFGFGGGSIATELNHLNMNVDAVEIDGRMLGIAKEYFHFKDTALTFTVDDARHYIRTKKKQYDLIVFDVLSGEVQPSYVFTTESFTELKKLLSPNGMIIIEFQELSDHEGPSAYQSISNTMLSLGYKVYCNITKDAVSDIVVTASLNDIDFSSLAKTNFNWCCAQQRWSDDFLKNPSVKVENPFPNGLILTDDKPMLDIINAGSVKAWRESAKGFFSRLELEQNQRIFK
jgi:predicted membrane-bound spermidine synthase